MLYEGCLDISKTLEAAQLCSGQQFLMVNVLDQYLCAVLLVDGNPGTERFENGNRYYFEKFYELKLKLAILK